MKYYDEKALKQEATERGFCSIQDLVMYMAICGIDPREESMRRIYCAAISFMNERLKK